VVAKLNRDRVAARAGREKVVISSPSSTSDYTVIRPPSGTR
jgi:hypothetical protein